MPENTNLDAANAAAAAVDPNSPTQAAFLSTVQARSPADVMRESQAGAMMPHARAVPGLDGNTSFGRGLDQALAAKQTQEGGDTDASAAASVQPSDQPSQPAEPRKLTDPPLVNKHQRSNFRKLEEARATDAQKWQQERTQLLGELETFRKGGSSVTQPDSKFADVLNENEKLKQELTLLDITRSPEFSARFDKPREIAITQAANMAGQKGADVKAILAMPAGGLRDAKMEELLAELPPSTGSIIKAANERLAALEFNKQMDIETARATMGERMKQQEQQVALQAVQRNREFDSVLNDWRSSVDVLDPAKHKGATALTQQAKQFYDGTGLSNSERAAVALQAALLPAMIEQLNEAHAEIVRLSKGMARYEDSLPGDSAAFEGNDQQSRQPRNPEERKAQFERGLDDVLRQDPGFASQRRARLY